MYAYLKIKETENTLILDKKIDVHGGLFQNNFFLFENDKQTQKDFKPSFLTERDMENVKPFNVEFDEVGNNDPFFSIFDGKSFSELKVKLPKNKSLTKFDEDEEDEKSQEKIKMELVGELLKRNVNIEEHISIFNNWTHKLGKKRNIDYYKMIARNPVVECLKENTTSILFKSYIGKQFSINKSVIEKIFNNYSQDISFLFQLLGANNDIDFKNIDFFTYGYLNSYWPGYTELLEKAITPEVHNKITYWLSMRTLSEKSAFYYLYKKWFTYAFALSAYTTFVKKYGADDIKTRSLLNLLTIVFSTTEGKKYKDAYIKDEKMFKNLQKLFFQEYHLDTNNYLILILLGFL